MYKLNANENKGITLVALIVTIIVLIILAGVSISVLFGSNGIITRTQQGAEDYKQAEQDEKDLILESEIAMLIYLGKNSSEIVSELGEVPKPEWEDNVEIVLQGVPIPKGFKYVEGTKSTGLVIKNNIDNNEFVWIPVNNINSMVNISNRIGNLYKFFIAGTPVVPLDNLELISQTPSGDREPGIISNYDETGSDLVGITLSLLQDEFDEMVNSVKTYKGFYVGRYETSWNGIVVESKKEKEPMSAAVTSGNTWYGMYEKQKSLYNNTVKSSMIWGCQWDQIMIWMKEEPNRIIGGEAKYITNSTRNGELWNRRKN